ncbi:hypothetical protein EPI10_027737 [Gossypium australe]|uniref:Uncharacterized protein n=1 Tax=Gossypium australe TaxID=47621 RepID=A0A5B6UV37_9ROSI|nr:hypothetical protein EPI10_027737 [Gossypium australe]
MIKLREKHRNVDNFSVNKLDGLVNNLSADNVIFFNDDKVPPGGMGSKKALYITTYCKGYTLPEVFIDNGFALNVLPLSTLNRLPVDSSHMKTCHNIERAFDGIERKVIGRIEISLLIGPNTYKALDSFSRSSAPSLHQKLKLVIEGRLVTINIEEDIIALVNRSKIPTPKVSKTTTMGLQLMVRKGALPGRGLGKYLQGRIVLAFRKARCKTEEEGTGKEVGEEEGVTDWGRDQMGADDFSHISETFVSGEVIYPEQNMIEKESLIIKTVEEMLGNLNINVISKKGAEEENLSKIRLYTLESVLNNWTSNVKNIPIALKLGSNRDPFVKRRMSPNINDMSDAAADSEPPFE